MPPHRNVIAGGRGMGPAVASRWAGAVAHNRVQAILASWAWWPVAGSSVSTLRPVFGFQRGNSRFPQIFQLLTSDGKRCAFPASDPAPGRTRGLQAERLRAGARRGGRVLAHAIEDGSASGN
jgi:hypothetical protein